MIKWTMKILKYAILIYLMMFIKNLYSETYHDNDIITVSMPEIIDIEDLQPESIHSGSDRGSDELIYAERMAIAMGSHNFISNQPANKAPSIKSKSHDSITSQDYRKFLEEGLTSEDKRLIQEYKELQTAKNS